jgi:hypothetical protein
MLSTKILTLYHAITGAETLLVFLIHLIKVAVSEVDEPEVASTEDISSQLNMDVE